MPGVPRVPGVPGTLSGSPWVPAPGPEVPPAPRPAPLAAEAPRQGGGAVAGAGVGAGGAAASVRVAMPGAVRVAVRTLCLAALLGALGAGGTELTLELPDSAQRCFHQELESGIKFTLDYQVLPCLYLPVPSGSPACSLPAPPAHAPPPAPLPRPCLHPICAPSLCPYPCVCLLPLPMPPAHGPAHAPIPVPCRTQAGLQFPPPMHTPVPSMLH